MTKAKSRIAALCALVMLALALLPPNVSANNTQVRRYLARGDFWVSCTNGDAWLMWHDGASIGVGCNGPNVPSGNPYFYATTYYLYQNDAAIGYRYNSNYRICGYNDYGSTFKFRVRDLGCN